MMRTPTAQEFNAFFHAMDYCANIAGQTGKGLTARRAITAEKATLQLLKERHDIQGTAKADIQPDHGTLFLAPYLPKDGGTPTFGEAGSGPFPHGTGLGDAVERVKNPALIFLSALAIVLGVCGLEVLAK